MNELAPPTLQTLEKLADRYLENMKDGWVHFTTTVIAIRDSGQWKEVSRTWADYINNRFGVSYNMLRHYMRGQKVAEAVLETNVMLSEGTIRALRTEYSDEQIIKGVALASKAVAMLDMPRVNRSSIAHAIEVLREFEDSEHVWIGENAYDGKQNPFVVATADRLIEQQKVITQRKMQGKEIIGVTVAGQVGNRLTVHLPDGWVFKTGEKVKLIVQVSDD